MQNRDITGIILAGGKSSRMGVNKTLLNIGDKTIIEIIVDTMKSVFENVMIIANETEIYNFLKLKVYSDIYKGKGPLSGIHSGLVNSDTINNFILSCDMPLVSKGLINYLAEYNSEISIRVASVNSDVQPLCGIYSKEVIPAIENILTDENYKNYSVQRLLDLTNSQIIDIANTEIYKENILLNINRMEDYQFIKRILV